VSAVYPQLTQKRIVRHTASWNWDTYRWSEGAFAWFMPGQHTVLHRHLVALEGRLFFAGEHISLTHSWMRGALESALQAVRDMLARRLEAALQLARGAMEFSRVHKERDNQTGALRLLGEIAAQRDPREVVEA
jgi:hypothetical protein